MPAGPSASSNSGNKMFQSSNPAANVAPPRDSVNVVTNMMSGNLQEAANSTNIPPDVWNIVGHVNAGNVFHLQPSVESSIEFRGLILIVQWWNCLN